MAFQPRCWVNQILFFLPTLPTTEASFSSLNYAHVLVCYVRIRSTVASASIFIVSKVLIVGCFGISNCKSVQANITQSNPLPSKSFIMPISSSRSFFLLASNKVKNKPAHFRLLELVRGNIFYTTLRKSILIKFIFNGCRC